MNSELLAEGTMEVLGRMPYSSNVTLLTTVTGANGSTRAIYKPTAGERPLWDFPSGLARREVAAYELSAALGWDVIPATVLREDGPHGEGSLQWFIDHDPEIHYFTLREDDELVAPLQRMAAFDLVANNTDRKSGHVLQGPDGRLWGIDNALCFHAEFKVRTVIWDFAGAPIEADDVAALRTLADNPLPPALSELLDPFEREGVRARARALADAGELPHDPTGRRYPWPLV